MKVDGITLLQMIKDGKLKDKTTIKIYYHNVPTRHILVYNKGELGWKPGEFLVGDLCRDEYLFEIIEEVEKTKEIEPLEFISFNKFKSMCPEERYAVTAKEYDKLEELRVAINYLLKKEEGK